MIYSKSTFFIQMSAALILIMNSIIIQGQTQQSNQTDMKQQIAIDNSKKRVLARGCDPVLSERFAQMVPPLIGNAEYIPTTNDVEFFKKLESEEWSVIYFAPGACRFSAANQRIPGTNEQTKTWTLEEYYAIIHEHQGESIEIVESLYESESLNKLNKALDIAREIEQ